MPGLAKLILVALCLYGAYVALLYLAQDHLLFLPSRELSATPANLGLEYEDVEVTTADGVRLHGWLIPAERESGGVVLYCHGNAGNISYLMDFIAAVRAVGLSVLVFDYRGYGKSGGAPSEAGLTLDARAMWTYLTETRGVPAGRIIAWGHSLGAAVAADLAAEVHPAALVLESGFTSLPELAAELYPMVPARLLSRFRFDTRAALRRVECPVLVLYGARDDIVGAGHAERLLAAAPERGTMLRLRGGHNDGFAAASPVETETVRRFLQEALGAGAWP